MTSSIEKNLSRLFERMATIDRKLDAIASTPPPPSALGSIRTDNLGEVMNAAAADNLTGAAGRLRALHNGRDEFPEAAGQNPFGKPASVPKVIDAEYTEIKTAENEHGAS